MRKRKKFLRYGFHDGFIPMTPLRMMVLLMGVELLSQEVKIARNIL